MVAGRLIATLVGSGLSLECGHAADAVKRPPVPVQTGRQLSAASGSSSNNGVGKGPRRACALAGARASLAQLIGQLALAIPLRGGFLSERTQTMLAVVAERLASPRRHKVGNAPLMHLPSNARRPAGRFLIHSPARSSDRGALGRCPPSMR